MTRAKRKKLKAKKKRRSNMAEENPETIHQQPNTPAAIPEKNMRDGVNQITLDISRGADSQSLDIYIRAPILAEIVRKMAPGNFAIAEYAEPYKAILMPLEGKKDRCVTRPAVTKITNNFAKGADWSWEAPRAVLIYNPDKLAAGYTINIKLDAPITHSDLKKWGDKFRDGCKDIIANARPFKMSWWMDEQKATT